MPLDRNFQRSPPFGRKLLGIVKSIGKRVTQNHGPGDDRSGERPSPRFIDANYHPFPCGQGTNRLCLSYLRYDHENDSCRNFAACRDPCKLFRIDDRG
jgi:hypothetical protein